MSYEQNPKEKFFETGAFTIFGEPLKNLLEEEKDSLPEGSERLLRRGWERACFSGPIHRHGISGVVASRLEELASELHSIGEMKKKKILIYGAGLQTAILLQVWKKLSLPRVSGIIVTENSNHSVFHGFPLLNLASVVESETNLIVLSSKSFESEMAANLDKSLPSVKRLSFWVKELTRL